jgi:hypothetical protein
VYTNFFVELVYEEDGDQSLLEINACRNGAKAYELMKILERSTSQRRFNT